MTTPTLEPSSSSTSSLGTYRTYLGRCSSWMQKLRRRAPLAAIALLATACASQEIPQAYRGRVFSRTGVFALYRGSKGFTGPVLGPGTYFTGPYNDIKMVECSMVTMREPLNALTKDGVQFGLDIYVRFSADCNDGAVEALLNKVVPDANGVITNKSLYEIYVRPALGEAVRSEVSPVRANDINDRREELLASIRKRFIELIEAREKDVVSVYEVNLSNLDFPDAMDAANVERAVQGVLKDKAIAERERVTAEIETMGMRRQLAEREGEVAAVRIERIGDALARHPEYLQYDLQMKLPEIYSTAGANGNLVITAPSPSVMVNPSGVRPRLPPPPAGSGRSVTTYAPGSGRDNLIKDNERKAGSKDP